jgi:hypothetical protein
MGDSVAEVVGNVDAEQFCVGSVVSPDSGAHQYGRASERRGGDDIAWAVTDEPAARGVEIQSCRRFPIERRTRLAALAASLGGVGAMEDQVEADTELMELALELLLDREEVALGVEPPTDARLIGDDHERESVVGERSQGIGNPGKEFYLAGV